MMSARKSRDGEDVITLSQPQQEDQDRRVCLLHVPLCFQTVDPFSDSHFNAVVEGLFAAVKLAFYLLDNAIREFQ